MTIYKDINAFEIGFGQPITCQLFAKLRNNPLSIAEGNSPADRKYEVGSFEYSTATLGEKDRLVAYRENYLNAGGSNSTALGVPFRVNRAGIYNIHNRITDTAGGTITTKVNGIVQSTLTATAGAALNAHILVQVSRRDMIEIELTKDAGDSSGTVSCQSWMYTSNPHSDYGCMYGFKNTLETSVFIQPATIVVDTF